MCLKPTVNTLLNVKPLEFPPNPFPVEQVSQLVELLKTAPTGEEDFFARLTEQPRATRC